MRKIKLYIACSLDGYIATMDNGLDWLTEFPNPQNDDYGYDSFYDTIGTLIMGGNTYRAIANMEVEWPYEGKMTYLVSRTEQTLSHNITLLSSNWLEKLGDLKNEEGKDIWVVGGGEIISQLINNQLLDEMIITYIPVLLGEGKSLYPSLKQQSSWKTTETICFKSGVMQAVFQLNR